MYERQYLSPRPPPKISLRHDLNWTKGNDQLGSSVEHQPVGRLVQQSLGEALQAGSSKPTQFPKPIEDRTRKPVTQEIAGKSQAELSSSVRTGEPVKDPEGHDEIAFTINFMDQSKRQISPSLQCKWRRP